MNTPKIPPSLKPALWGAVGGAVLLAVVGFTWGGWMTAGTAERTAEARATTAVVTALAPICVSQFQLAADAPAKQGEMNKISVYERDTFVEKAGWATMPGSKTTDPNVAKACADLISQIKF
jgi:alpha/beta superfamily hydrolase